MLNRNQLSIAMDAISKAVKISEKEYADGDLTGEEDMTSALLAHMRRCVADAYSDYGIDGHSISAAVCKKHKSAEDLFAQEKEFGSDGVVSINHSAGGGTIGKGFLFQAKKLDQNGRVDLTTLQKQCTSMLKYTSSAFVFLYSTSGIKICTAQKVMNKSSGVVRDDIFYSLETLLYDLFVCWVGDYEIKKGVKESLENLRRRYNADHALHFESKVEIT